jgi:hypothetical protein
MSVKCDMHKASSSFNHVEDYKTSLHKTINGLSHVSLFTEFVLVRYCPLLRYLNINFAGFVSYVFVRLKTRL